MKFGLFIDHDFITCFYDNEKTGKLQFIGLGKEEITYLYFTSKSKEVSSLELKPEARLSYYPGHPDILGEILKLADQANKDHLFHGKPVNVFKLLDSAIEQHLNELIQKLNLPSDETLTRPFYLIIPQFAEKKLTDKIVGSVKKVFHNVQVFRDEFIYVFSLISDNLLPDKGTALFIDMGFSDLYLNVLKFNEDDVKLTNEDKISDTKLVSAYLQLIATEMVETAGIVYNKSDQPPEEEKKKQIERNIPVAQDIINELKSVNDWNSIEAEVELSDNTGGPVMIYREKLQQKFHTTLEEEGIDKRLTTIIKTHHPDFIVLYGENLENPSFIDYLGKFKNCKIIRNDEDSFRKICNTFIENIRDAEQTKSIEEEPDVQPDIQPAPSSIRPSDAVLPAIEENIKPEIGHRKLLTILIPVALIAIAIAIYFLFWSKNDKTTIAEKEIPSKTINRLSAHNFIFSPNVGDTQKIYITSSGSWQIDSLPGWLNSDIREGSGSGYVSLFPGMNNDKSENRKELFYVVFENDEHLPVEVSQAGLVASNDAGVNNNLATDNADATNKVPVKQKSNDPTKINLPKKNQTTEVSGMIEIAESLLSKTKWDFADLNTFTESVSNNSGKINYQQLYKFIDPRCEVFIYINNDKISSESLESFLNGVKLGLPVKLVRNSLKYNDQGKITEFGKE